MLQVRTTIHRFAGHTVSTTKMLSPVIKDPEATVNLFLDEIHSRLERMAKGHITEIPSYVVFEHLNTGDMSCHIKNRRNDDITILLTDSIRGEDDIVMNPNIPYRRRPESPDIQQLDVDYTLESFSQWIDQWLPVVKPDAGKPQFMYHLSNPKNLNSILTKGLIPNYGDNSASVDDDRTDTLYLTNKYGLSYWRILLNCDMLVKIDPAGLSENGLEEIPYSLYSEWTYAGRIDPRYLTIVPMPDINPYVMRELCLGVFESIQRACRQAAEVHRYAEKPELPEGYDELVESYKTNLSSILGCAKNLNFKSISQSEYQAILSKSAEDGEYVMTDRYIPCRDHIGPFRLWEMLAEYPTSPYKEQELELFKLIVKNWTARTRTIHTGGWCES